ncbi:MAG: PEP-CTERM sorting domain-containing protein [Armatimonadetes bacterium]|nr:PEP-CTERM sorting domain-containing protein [Armatimonadota bacterium]
MRYSLVALLPVAFCTAKADLLYNGNLDHTYQQEIVSGFFLPKPFGWENTGTRTITGPYEDEMSSESWAGPAPTPVTHDGFDEQNGANGLDWGLFFKPFSGNVTDGAATGTLSQTVAASAGLTYNFSGWAGAEANALMHDATFDMTFLRADHSVISGASLSLLPNLFVPNGQPFNYKLYNLVAVAPGNTAFVTVGMTMHDATSNPAGGGQALVADDFELNVVPEPGSMAVLAVGALALLRKRRGR